MGKLWRMDVPGYLSGCLDDAVPVICGGTMPSGLGLLEIHRKLSKFGFFPLKFKHEVFNGHK